MTIPYAKQVYDDPTTHWAFLTQDSDDKFEDQHFDRKVAGQSESDASTLRNQLKNLREAIQKSVSAFANSNTEGGLLAIGIASDGTVKGIDHLTEEQKNSLTDFSTLLRHQAAQGKFHQGTDVHGNQKTICLIFVPYAESHICETTERIPRAWTRNGAQNIAMTQEVRDRIKGDKKIVNFEFTRCCKYESADVAQDILMEFRKVFHIEYTSNFTDERLLREAGAIVQYDGAYWFTNAGLLFFASNPQRIFPNIYIRLLRFSVSYNRILDRGLPDFDQNFSGPLTKQIRDARTFFQESAFFKRYQKRKPEGGFVEEQEFPSTVIDEAIVNAVSHRDYQTRLPITCESYSDAFLVKNPGRILQRNTDLPNEFTLFNTVLDSMPRNSRLLEWLKLMKDPDGRSYVQAISEGTKQMLAEMGNLGLPAPSYQLAENQTQIKLENNAEEREAAILAASQMKSTEYGNLFPLRIQQGDKPVDQQTFNLRYKEFMQTFSDTLAATGWFIDRSGYSRIIAHRQGIDLEAPENVKHVLRFYPAYEFQIRQYFDHFYLCLDYKCQVRNVLPLTVVSQKVAKEKITNSRCVAKLEHWREGKIVDFDAEFAKVYFFDTEKEERVPANEVIPTCSLATLEKLLKSVDVAFDLSAAIKEHSLASKSGGARKRAEKIIHMVEYVSENVFPILFGNFAVRVIADPLQLFEQTEHANKGFLVHRLPEPIVEFRQHRSSPDVRNGITEYGAYEVESREIELIPVCLNSMRFEMKELIERLKFGKYKYRGAERTFSTRFSYSQVVGVDFVEDTKEEILRLLEENPNWISDRSLKRIFLIQIPADDYSKDDYEAPYYVVKRLLLEKGIPCQMIDTRTLQNPDWKDLNLALNIAAKCGVRPWVLPDAIPNADFFIGLSYTQSFDRQRIMGFANVFNSYGKWEFYSGNTSFFNFEDRTIQLAQLAEETLRKLRQQLSHNPRVVFHHSAKLAFADRNSILEAARKVFPEGIFTFVWINSHHNVRFFDNRPETDGSLRRGSYVEVAKNRIYLSTTGYNPYRRALGTPKPLEVSMWTQQPEGSPRAEPDLRVLAVQVLNLTKLNWASTESFCGEPITLKYAGDIAYLTSAFLRQSEPFDLDPVLESTPWFI